MGLMEIYFKVIKKTMIEGLQKTKNFQELVEWQIKLSEELYLMEDKLKEALGREWN